MEKKQLEDAKTELTTDGKNQLEDAKAQLADGKVSWNLPGVSFPPAKASLTLPEASWMMDGVR